MVDDKPYVRYEINSEISDRGLAFSIDRAIKAYLENHKVKLPMPRA